MAKKNKKIEKETRRLIEGIGEMIKKKGDRYKFKTKNKKTIRQIKRTCPHWRPDKGRDHRPAVVLDDVDQNMWRCKICGATFPVAPLTPEDYDKLCDEFLGVVNQMQFWGVNLGGDADDTKMFLALRRQVPRFRKVTHQIQKRVNKRQAWEANKKNSDALQQFDAYSGFNYR